MIFKWSEFVQIFWWTEQSFYPSTRPFVCLDHYIRLLQGLFAGLLLVSLLNIATCLPSPEPEPSPIIPSKLALLYTPFVCPFFYVGKAVKAVETAVNAVTGKWW